MSACHGSRYTAKLPLRFPPPWSTYRAVSLKTRSMGTRPFDVPLVPLIEEPVDRMACALRPMPPACLLIMAQLLSVSKMPSMLSRLMGSRKHEAIWFLGVPELKRVGVACV